MSKARATPRGDGAGPGRTRFSRFFREVSGAPGVRSRTRVRAAVRMTQTDEQVSSRRWISDFSASVGALSSARFKRSAASS